MTKNWIIVLLALGLTACGVTSTAPLDDTYYWPDGQEQQATTNDTLP